METKRKFPTWLKVKMPHGANYEHVKNLVQTNQLNTVCEDARCPNIGECWDRGTATFMILGDICTRACRYCSVKSGVPTGLDLEEPKRLAETVETLGLNYAVITSVNRDDLPDGGAFIFASCITQIRKKMPSCKIEVLTPDFEGNINSLQTVIDAKPDTFNHNIETVERIFPKIRAKGDYRLSLEVLKNAKEISKNIITKSGIMVGLGETLPEITQTLEDLRAVNCDLVTIGQYLKPSKKHAQTEKWYKPEEFKHFEEIGYGLGFKHVASGPLVRSSYHADQQHEAAQLIMS
tara:strand:+ start:13763 stop:14638 length:876 start_codon:yes stop_codon:yes gene_type:complete